MPVYPFNENPPFATKVIGTIENLNRGFANSMSLKQGDQAFDRLSGLQVDLTSTGSVHNYALPAAVVVRWSGASAVTFTGIVAHRDGQIVVLQNTTSAQTLKVTHQDSGSSAENRIILPSTAGQIVGAGGSIGLCYDGAADRWRLLFVTPGRPITPAFSAGDYTAASGSWTVDAGDVVTLTYAQDGALLRVKAVVNTTDVSATPTELRRVIPGGFTAAKAAGQLVRVRNAGTYGTGYCYVAAAGTTLNWAPSTTAGGTWATTASDDTHVECEFEVEVQ